MIVEPPANIAPTARNPKYLSGNFHYRTSPDSKDGKLLDTLYTALAKTDEVKCERAPCDLYYISATGPRKIPIPPGRFVPGQWTKLSLATEDPDSPIGALQDDRSPVGERRAGRTKSGTCPGSGLNILAPVCDEVIDIDTFGLEWKPSPGLQGHVEIRLTVPDSRDNGVNDSPLFMANIEDGKYDAKDLRNQIQKLQSSEDQTRLTIGVRQSDSVYAIRTVLVPTRQEDRAFQKKLDEIEAQQIEALRPISVIRAAVDAKRWTFAAKEALKISRGDQRIPLFDQFALIGLCQSGYREDLATVRAGMAGVDTARFCEVPPEAPDETAPAPLQMSTAKKKRAGFALLIGNSDYPGDQLDSVKSDVESIHRELSALNFDVAEVHNLDKQEDFRKAITEFSKQQTADDVVFVYYSGHGMQEKEKTYLLGTKFANAGSSGVLTNAFELDEVVAQIQQNPALARIVVFDACRNNVFTRDRNPEMGEILFKKKISNTFVMLANTPGKTVNARSGIEFLSPFTEGLVYGLQHSGTGIVDIFNAAKAKTEALSPGQVPELEKSDVIDPKILSGVSGGPVRDRPAELVAKACPYYHSRSWSPYLSLMKEAKVLSDDASEQSRLQAEIDFATLVQQAESAEIRGDDRQAEQYWQKAAATFPGRNWVRMRAALEALVNDNVEGAMLQLVNMPKGPDPDVARRADDLWKELEKTFPLDSQEAAKVAAGRAMDAGAAECVVEAQP
jgi:hypothetical protein